MTDLEQRYRRLFAAYPLSHRREREDEMVGVLLDVARPGQHRPGTREAVSIVGNGLLARARSADDWRTGARWAGVVSLALAVGMAGLAVGVGVLPPTSGRIAGPGYGPPGPSPWWAPVAFWATGLALGIVVAVGGSRRMRVGSTAGIVALALLGTAAGSDVAGLLRWYTVPFLAFLLLSTASAGAPRRVRLAAVVVGVALAAGHLVRYLDRYADSGWEGDQVRLWTVMSRWSLSFDLTVLRPGYVWAALGAALIATAWRPVAAVAAGLMVAPLAILAAGPAASVGGGPGEQVVAAMAAAIGLLLLVVLVGRVRREGPVADRG